MDVFLAVDGGGTNTRCVIASDASDFLVSVSGGPTAIAHGLDAALTALLAVVEKALNEAVSQQQGHDTTPVVLQGACLGVSGISTTDAGLKVQQALVRFLQERGHPLPPWAVRVVSDSEIALVGALSGRPGIVLIVGTGATAVGRDPQGAFFRADGWGWLLGDAGSGYAIGRSALRSAFAGLDGRKAETRLISAIPAHFGVTRLEDIVPHVYFEAWPPAKIATLTPLVARLADEGDAISRQILSEAGVALAESVCAVRRRLTFGPHVDVSYQGSVIRKIPLIRQILHDTLRQEAPGSRLIAPEREPIEGALLLAREVMPAGYQG
ncbi:MAG: N-acetylglucosamine kinase [Limnochordia bacterium]|jgi:N-acetylglucosamine kinase-like BadF-type ATPase